MRSNKNSGPDRAVSENVRSTLREGLLRWYRENGRDLPWRKSYIPYQVWISEIMLQQTQIKTMLPYFFRWMERFPHPAAIAEASEDEILRHWEGLGYYARAKNIQKAARLMVSEHGGNLPSDFESVRKLPGVGQYTAGAIMSFAFNADFPAADANAARILARIFDISIPSDCKEFRNAVWYYATDILPKGRSRDFNQALMDFGSMVCSPRGPLCGGCPIASCCESMRLGVAEARPVNRAKKTVTNVDRAIGICIGKGEVLLRKRPAQGLMPNLWEFPGGEARSGESPEEALRRAWHEEFGAEPGQLEKLAVIKHSHTSFRVTLHVFLCNTFPREMRGLTSRVRLIPAADLDSLAFPSAHRKAIRDLAEKRPELFSIRPSNKILLPL